MSAMERERAPAEGSSLVLDIGGDTGAVVVYLAALPRDGELEMRPTGDPAGRFHTGVHIRGVAGVRTPVAVFPAVRAGDYEVLDARLAPVAELSVAGGRVTELDLRPEPPAPTLLDTQSRSISMD
jgi:hypothetical protein